MTCAVDDRPAAERTANSESLDAAETYGCVREQPAPPSNDVMNRTNLKVTAPWPRAARVIREHEAQGFKLKKRSSEAGMVTLEFERGTSKAKAC